MRKTLMALVMLAAAVTAGQAHAVILQYQAFLDGLQEAPPNASPAYGYVALDFDTVTNNIQITSGNYYGLVAPVTAAHIHQGAIGVAGPVIIGLTPVGSPDGTLTGGGILTALQVTALNTNGLYVNVHSTAFPGGEIRGVITLVPSPGALALFGLAGMVGLGRRRRT